MNKNIVLKVKVLSSGKILVDNNVPTGMSNLISKLQWIKNNDGVVWYYRENSGHIPNEIADEIFSKILGMKLPLSLSSKPDFSDWIDSNGESHHR